MDIITTIKYRGNTVFVKWCVFSMRILEHFKPILFLQLLLMELLCTIRLFLVIRKFWERMQLTVLLFTVYGAIIGKQMGREVEVMNSFELKYQIVGGLVVLSKEYYKVKEQQCKYEVKPS